MDASDVDGINASLIGASFLPYWPSLCSFQSLKRFEFSTKSQVWASLLSNIVRNSMRCIYFLEWDYEKLDEVYLIYKSGIMPEDEICVLADSAAFCERVVPPFELASKGTWEA